MRSGKFQILPSVKLDHPPMVRSPVRSFSRAKCAADWLSMSSWGRRRQPPDTERYRTREIKIGRTINCKSSQNDTLSFHRVKDEALDELDEGRVRGVRDQSLRTQRRRVSDKAETAKEMIMRTGRSKKATSVSSDPLTSTQMTFDENCSLFAAPNSGVFQSLAFSSRGTSMNRSESTIG